MDSARRLQALGAQAARQADPELVRAQHGRQPRRWPLTTAKAVERGLMAQADYAAAAGTVEVDCEACGAAAGTVQHRYYGCVAHRGARSLMGPGPQQMGASASGEEAIMLWTRALVQDPSARYPFRADLDTDHWHGGGERVLEGTITVDGSLIGGAAGLGATGWAAVALIAAADGRGEGIGMAISGTMPNELPVHRKSGRAELWSVYQALRHAVEPGRIVTDYGGLIGGLARGERWTVRAASAHADVWRLIWRKLADFGGEGVWEFGKVKAHLGVAAKAGLEGAARLEVQGNEEADRLAKAQSRSHAWLLAQQVAVRDQTHRADMALKHIDGFARAVIVAGDGWGDFDVELVKQLAGPKEGKTGQADAANGRPEHKWFADGARWRCAACLSTTAEPLRRAGAAPCRGHPAAAMVVDVLQMYPVVLGHALWQTGDYVWCARCGAHGSKAPKGLKKQCRAVASISGARARDNLSSGRAPAAKRRDERIGAPSRFTLRTWLAFQVAQDGRSMPEWAEAIAAALEEGGLALQAAGESAEEGA
jgi:hypothetical protein